MQERKPACWRKGRIFESEGEESERASRWERGMSRELRMAESSGHLNLCFMKRGGGGSRPQ